jgi:hypothetical protein
MFEKLLYSEPTSATFRDVAVRHTTKVAYNLWRRRVDLFVRPFSITRSSSVANGS